MEIVLKEEDFVNNEYSVVYGNRKAVFTIIDEEFAGLNRLGRINRINVLVYEYDDDGNVSASSLCTSIIGIGDGIVGVKTDVPELRGKLMTHENMTQCVVELYE